MKIFGKLTKEQLVKYLVLGVALIMLLVIVCAGSTWVGWYRFQSRKISQFI